jgi:predicted PurR-regulated permease PerM
MAESLYGKIEKRRERDSRKVYALVAVIVILVGVIGYFIYVTYGGDIWEESITSPGQAADALSDLGNDLSEIQEDLRDIGNIL